MTETISYVIKSGGAYLADKQPSPNVLGWTSDLRQASRWL